MLPNFCCFKIMQLLTLATLCHCQLNQSSSKILPPSTTKLCNCTYCQKVAKALFYCCKIMQLSTLHKMCYFPQMQNYCPYCKGFARSQQLSKLAKLATVHSAELLPKPYSIIAKFCNCQLCKCPA